MSEEDRNPHAIAPYEEKIKYFSSDLRAMTPQFAVALGKLVEPEHFVRVALTSVRRNAKLLECSKESMMGALIECAQIGLEPDGVLGTAYLVPFNNEVTLIVGYRGYETLAVRSGYVNSIDGRLVYANDEFDYREGSDARVHHKPALFDPRGRGELIGAYSVAQMRHGPPKVQAMSLAECEAIRKRAPSSKSRASPWNDKEIGYAQMVRKCPIRRLCKDLPLGARGNPLARAVSLDEMSEMGMSQQLEEHVKKSAAEKPVDILDAVIEESRRKRGDDTTPGKTKMTAAAKKITHAPSCPVNAPDPGPCECQT